MDRNTELRRLAKILHKSPAELDYLNELDANDLYSLRKNFQDGLLRKFGSFFEKLADSGKLIPTTVSAFLCVKVFGPVLTANLSYYTPVSRSMKFAKLFDADFMAEVAREQIPERAAPLLAELPVDLMKKVTCLLLESKEYHLLGGFTDYMPELKAIEIMEVINDPADHIRISTFTQRKDRVAKLAGLLSDQHLIDLITIASTDDGFLVEMGMIVAEMDTENQQRVERLTHKVRHMH